MLALVAALLLGVAAALMAGTGLPQRADYTGQFIGAIGRFAPEVGAIAPPFTSFTLSGGPLRLSALRGQPVIINFWATWCGPCRAEMPELQTLYEQYAADGLRVLAVNLGERQDVVSAWVDDFGLTFDIVLDPQRDLEALYRVIGQPATYVIAPDGRISDIFYGATTAATLQSRLPFG